MPCIQASVQAHAARSAPWVAGPADTNPAARYNTSGAVIGRLEIAQLGLSVPVLEDYDPATLVRGVGHVRGTAVPGGLGNLVLAGHRDTFFRPLRGIHRGMAIEVADAGGRWRYNVDSTEIVSPDQVRVLDVGSRPELTLITCYPFDFIGAAPMRFIVHAHLVSADRE